MTAAKIPMSQQAIALAAKFMDVAHGQDPIDITHAVVSFMLNVLADCASQPREALEAFCELLLAQDVEKLAVKLAAEDATEAAVKGSFLS